MKYPFLDLKDSVTPYRDEIVEAVTKVIDSGRYIGGPVNEGFEAFLAASVHRPYAVGTANGLDALRLIFRGAIEIGRLAPGDEVIVPANTYIASILAVTDSGLIPVFVEPDETTMNLDWAKVEEAISPRTRALMTVHLYGAVSWDEKVVSKLREKDIFIVEDNAQAIGALTPEHIPTGGLGDAAAFSFYPTKNIGALGDAGAVTTNDADLAKAVRAIANYGSDRRYHNIYRGLNSRLDPIQAAILSVRLKYLDRENERRRELARIYSEMIRNRDLILPVDTGIGHVWHQYVVRHPERDSFRQRLTEAGVGTDIHYAVPPHCQPCYSDEFGHLHLPVTERLADTVLSLPISPTTSPNDARAIAEIINNL